jgi:hypothetical protein
MKLTETITNLLFNLSELESVENVQFLTGDASVLRSNLLKLYRATDNVESHGVIIEIMRLAGYPWFGELVKSNEWRSIEWRSDVKSAPQAANGDEYWMSEDEFMNLIPANSHFH